VLEALIRRHGARASPLARALAEGWRRADGAEPGEADLRALLDAHGLLHSFQRRERDAALHALRASGGIRHGAAAALGIAPEAFDALLARSGAEREAEALRDERRREIRRRATLSERAHLLLAEAERLADLGILDEVGADLAKRLPEHLRALRAGGAASLEAALGRSLSLGREEVRALGRRLGLDLGDGDPSAAPGTARPPGRPGSRRRPPL
jgi:hypothetical protein